MFKFSLNLVKQMCGFEISSDEFFKILNLQGFEVDETFKKDDDTIVTIEVKANRPDMLCHLGIAREICAFKGKEIPRVEVSDKPFGNNLFPMDVEVDPDACSRFCLLILEGIDNRVQTPNYIKTLLQKLGINCVNAVVDITNYVMLKYGQPMHTYDADKIHDNCMNVQKYDSESEILTLSGSPLKVKKGDIVVCDKKNILCVAGVVGADISSVQNDTKNVVLEAACFNEVSIRLTSRRMKVSTPSSFRFERGIDIQRCMDIANICAHLIVKICGGKIREGFYDFYPQKPEKNHIDLRISRVNSLLGVNLDKKIVMKYLQSYEFKCIDKNEDGVCVTVPDYRLDVKCEVDIIEEVARIHGYDNIAPTMPTVQLCYNKNTVWDNIDKLREIFVGLGFDEVITYSFIPSDFIDTFKVPKGDRLHSDLILKNPINKEYALMRPTLVYSLVDSLVYNYSLGNMDLSLFEMGKVYFKDETSETNYGELDVAGFIFSGNRIYKGWGIDRNIKYSYYDLLNYVNIIFGEFGQDFKLERSDYRFCEEGTGFNIISDGNVVGFICEINKKSLNKPQNIKLIKGSVFYCEIIVKALRERTKKLKFESKYPSVMRVYNFMVNKNIVSDRIEKIILESSDLVTNIEVCDLYKDKNMNDDEHAILYKVKYCSRQCTLTSNMIENIEQKFITKLASDLNVTLKN